MYIPLLRRKNTLIEEIKRIDKDTAITENLIESLIRKNKITTIKFLNSNIINLDELAMFLGGIEETNEEINTSGNI